MLQDLAGSLLAVLAFAAVLYAPGYIAAYATDLFGFRQMGLADRSLWAVACSFIVTPIAAYLAGRSLGLNCVCWLFGGSAVVAALLLFRSPAGPQWPARDRQLAIFVALGWTVFVLVMLVDFQYGHKLFFSVVTADMSYRIHFTDAVLRTGIPPANPLYFAGSPAPMRYYYFWYVLCAAIAKLAHVSARQAFIAGCVWSGFGLLVTVVLFGRHFFQWQRRQICIALALLAVTGADLLPSLGNAVLQSRLSGDIEWWSVDPIDAWPDSILWVPHHVAGLIGCLLCFLLLWRTLEPLSRAARRWALVFAAFAFAGAFGLSVYVAFGFALLMLAWLSWLMLKRLPDYGTLWRRTLAVGFLSAALLAPFVHELIGGLYPGPAVTMNGNHTTQAPAQPTHLFTLSVRPMIDSDLITGLPLLAPLNRAHPRLLDQSVRLVLLLPGLAMELGPYGAVLGLLLFQRKHRAPHPAHDTALFFTVAGLVMSIFLSSAVISNNDFGYRAVMLPQFFLMFLTAELLGSWWPAGNSLSEAPPVVAPTRGKRRLLAGLLALGVAGSVWGAFLLRAWLPIETLYPQHGFSQLPEDAFEIRQAFTALNRIASPHAVIAFHSLSPRPDDGDVMKPAEYNQRLLVANAGRQILNAETKCATQFGGDPAPCAAIQRDTATLFATPAPGPAWAQSFCHRFGVQYLVAGRADLSTEINPAAWQNTLPTVVFEPHMRIVQCADDAPLR